jgi:hypothetical protein
MKTKICTKCGIAKPLTEFDRVVKTSERRRQPCRECKNEQLRRWRADNPDKVKTESRRYYLGHRNKRIDAASRWTKKNWQRVLDRRNTNREEYLRKRREWYAKNAERERAKHKEYVLRNKAKALECTREWRSRNKTHIKEYNSKWSAEHPDSMMERCHKRRARINNSAEHFTQEQFRDLVKSYKGRCLRCGATDKQIVPDHVVPLSRGGSDSIDNIQPLCRGCNSWKHSKTVDFRQNQA